MDFKTLYKSTLILSTLALLSCGGSSDSASTTSFIFPTFTLTGPDAAAFGSTLKVNAQERTTTSTTTTIILTDRNYDGTETPAQIGNGFNINFETAVADPTNTLLVVTIVLNGTEHNYACDTTAAQAPDCDANSLSYNAATKTLTVNNAQVTNVPNTGMSFRVSGTVENI
jgi:hypothetical protein